MEILIFASILIPIAGCILVLATPKGWIKRFSQGIAFLSFACTLIVTILFAAQGMQAMTVDVMYIGGLMVFSLVIDRLSVLIGLAVSLVGFLIVLYSTGYLSSQNRDHPEKEIERRYYFFMLGFMAAMAGVVFSGTIIAMLAFFEATGFCSWGLIGYYDNAESRRSAFKAIITTQATSIGLYFATVLLFMTTGSFQLSEIGNLDESVKTIVLGGIFLAAWGKSAQLPFHFWLPDAMVAPTPVSAYLHAASMVKAGVYILARSLLVAGNVPHTIGLVGAAMAVLTMLYGLAMYFPQRDIKRLLAYSTITQLAYIFLALSLSIFGSSMAFNGAVAHIFNHAFAKSLFFLVAGAIGYATGTRLLPSLRGLFVKMPLVGAMLAVATMAVVGIPPFNLFFSKFSIFAGGFEAARDNPLLMAFVVIAILESVVSFAWIFWVFSASAPGEPSEEVKSAIDIAPSMKFVLISLAVLTLVSGYFAAAWMG